MSGRRCGNVDGIDVGVGNQVLRIVVPSADVMLVGKIPGVRLGAATISASGRAENAGIACRSVASPQPIKPHFTDFLSSMSINLLGNSWKLAKWKMVCYVDFENAE